MLLAVHFKGLRYFDRPTLARNALFDPVLGSLKWCLVIAGLLLLLRVSRPAFLTAGGALMVVWAYRRIVRSGFFQEKLLQRDFDSMRRSRPGMSDEEILFELAYRRHPRWGPELIEQMVKDYPTVDSFARMLGSMERGFRGFRGRRPASPRQGKT